MAIEFECTNCGERYRLKDDVGGKKAKCRNPQCGKMMVIPLPKKATVPPTAPPPDVEATALAALNETPQEQVEKPAGDTIPMTCSGCDHKWTVPLVMAGKNVLCPECNMRCKVPIPKKAEAQDWRQGVNAGKPSLAKENFEKPKDVMSAGDAAVVTKKAWTAGGGADSELEPIPLSRRLKFIVPIVLVLGVAGYGIYSWWSGRTVEKEDQLITQAIDDFDANEVAAAEQPLFKAILYMAAGEHTLRSAKTQADLKKALEQFAVARNALDMKDAKLRDQVAAERNALVGELAVLILDLGGNDEQVKQKIRFHWIRPQQATAKLKINDTEHDVQEELSRTLQLVNSADPDFRAALTRRLTRELVKRGQPDLAEKLHTSLYAPKDADEGKAWVAMEMLHMDPTAGQPQQMAATLQQQLQGKPNIPWPVQALWIAMVGPRGKLPAGVPALGNGFVTEPTRMAYVCGMLLSTDKQPLAEIVKICERPGDANGRVRALAMCVEWAPDPTPALDALKILLQNINKGGNVTAVPMSTQLSVYRACQVSAEAGRQEPANALADGIIDEGLRTWAKGDVYRMTLTAENTQPADEAAFKLEDRPEKLKAGHAWARLWVARHNARLSGDRSKQKTAILNWPKSIHSIGMVGIALGLQDRDR